ncbi:MAG: hypothetical protein M3P08_07220 [Thermoproteota archaeon]|nr:hypothetical protein [Thermoproteota archaeon]
MKELVEEVRKQQESDELDQIYKQNTEDDNSDGQFKSHQPGSATLF